MRDGWSTVLKGLVVGATMIVPGVSGGTMAMVLGIYDRLISAISSLRENVKENLLFLAIFALGAGCGFYLFTTPVSWLLENYATPTILFFVGAVVCGIPVIAKKSEIEHISLAVVMYLVLGAVSVVFISKIPSDIFVLKAFYGIGAWLILFVAGFVTAAALILPGISFSHFLLVLGLYDSLLYAVKTLDFTFLLPLGSGIIVGVILLSRILENLIKKYPKQTYMIILGFIIGSIGDMLSKYL